MDHVGHDGRPPGGAGRRLWRRGPGVDEERPVAEHVEQRAQALERSGRGERVRGQLEADRAAVERGLERGGVRVLDAGHRPGRERARKRERALEPRVGQLGRFLRCQPVEAERRRRRDADELVAVGGGERDAPFRVMGRGVDRERRLARELQRPAVEPGRAAARAQGLQERGRPEVLVEVGAHGCLNRFSESVH